MASYKVVFLGLSTVGPEEESRLIMGLQKKFHLTPEKAERLLQKIPVVVKKDLSKEEAERFVRAFDEIGGRAKIEEEISTLEFAQEDEPRPKPEPSPQPRPAPYRPEPEKRTYKAGMVVCPQCGFEQPQTDECVKCGVIISKYVQFQEMARSVKDQVREISAEEYTPWESGGGGFIGAFFRTVQEVLFSPTQFFKKAAAGKGYGFPLVYGLITGIIGNGCAILWFWLLMAGFVPMDRIPFQYSLSILRVIIPLPFQVAIAIFVGSAIIHLCLMLVGGNNQGYRTTFRVICYSYSAKLFNIVPFVGSVVGFIYMIVLFIIGVREGHGIGAGKAALAVLLPAIVMFGLVIIAVVLAIMLIGSTGFFGGVRA